MDGDKSGGDLVYETLAVLSAAGFLVLFVSILVYWIL